MKDILIMGIESSCDETSVSIVKNGREVLSNVINSQIEIHELYGGVVPEIASRCHTEVINQIMKQALKEANVTLDDIDAIAVTYGPGLVGALLVGVSYAKGLSFATGKPLVPVNHIEGPCLVMAGAELNEHGEKVYPFFESLVFAEKNYFVLLNKGFTPQQARDVLPNATKTELIMTGFSSDWRHVMDLRLFGKTGQPHPDMVDLMQKAQKTMQEAGIWEDIMSKPSKFE